MSEKEILNVLEDIFRDVFDDETLVITNETSDAQIEGWDSLSQIRLIAVIEKTFHIKFSFGELNHSRNVREIVKFIREKA